MEVMRKVQEGKNFISTKKKSLMEKNCLQGIVENVAQLVITVKPATTLLLFISILKVSLLPRIGTRIGLKSDKWRETRWFMASATGEAKACIDGMISYLVKAVTNLDSGFSSDQSPGFKEPHTGGSLPPHPSQPFGQGEIGWCKTETVLTSE
ncbi:hypothetical protein DVH24_011281 [Malus domestica]|uniref:Uncharacterized protein n=1 Tax=Malus domestica TaxID=3750 RepID=A0A498JV55_MALDO|nr:hypothetical protein DVH24_011281 [Malus domestica]